MLACDLNPPADASTMHHVGPVLQANRSIKDVHPAWENFCGDDAMYAVRYMLDLRLPR